MFFSTVSRHSLVVKVTPVALYTIAADDSRAADARCNTKCISVAWPYDLLLLRMILQSHFSACCAECTFKRGTLPAQQICFMTITYSSTNSKHSVFNHTTTLVTMFAR